MRKVVPLMLIVLLLGTMIPLNGQAAQTNRNAQYKTDFSEHEAGAQPAGWSSRWNPVAFTVQDDPRRLMYEPSTDLRSLITFDKASEITGDVEVAGVVRAPHPMSRTRFQLHLHASGDADTTQSYYVDIQNDTLRLNRYSAGGFHNLASAPFSNFSANRWYQVVLQRSGDSLRAKVWPYGFDEPDEWMIETANSVLDGGSVGVGHFGKNTVNEWAWFSVGTGGETAPRAPDDLVPLPEQAQYETDFSGHAIGEQPSGWISRWNPVEFTVQDEPRRLVYEPSTDLRSIITFDEAGEVEGDVEVAGVVRVPSPMSSTRFQMHLHASGDASTTQSYYVDVKNASLRLNRYSAGSISTLTSVPFDGFSANRWYQVVLQRSGNSLRAKVWPYGGEEPDGWMIETTNSVLNQGSVGVGHFGTDTVNEWAWFAVGTGGMPASRAPEDLLPPPEKPDVVTGVAIKQGYGYATVSWEPVDDAVEYEIERTPMDGDQLGRTGEVVGRWFPDRYDGGELTFADAGFVLGERYRWRVRAVEGGIPGDWSDPVISDTKPLFGPVDYLTEFELSGGKAWTSHRGEQQLLQSIADASERVRLEEIGRTAQGFPLNLAIIGEPEPKTPKEIARTPSMLISCTVHGTEPAPREACMLLLRELAFTEDVRVSDFLEDMTVLIVPTVNPEGRSVNQRQNAAGQDLNRDHLLLEHPETFALAEVMRDYQPDVVIDGHEYQAADTSDLSAMWARSPNVGEELWELSQNDMTRGELFRRATEVGLWPLQYPLTPSDGWEAMLQNTAGLKNKVGLLLETRRRPGLTRPAEGDAGTLVTTPENQKRRVYTQLWAFRQMLDYYRKNIPEIQRAIAASKAAAIANEGPVYLDGMRDVPVTPPVNRPPTLVLDPAPCGYFITEAQYTRVNGQVPTVQDRLAAHGIEVEQVPDGILVTMEQPLRGLIPLVLDPEAPYGMVSAERLYDCDLDPSPEPDKTELQNRVNAILAENLNEDVYMEESWRELQNRLTQAEEVLNNPDATQDEIDDALEALNRAREGLKPVPTTVSDLQRLVEQFAEEGEFANETVVRWLLNHLTAVSHYEDKGQADKVTKHLRGFKQLLNYQKESGLLSGKAYEVLYTSVHSLIKK